MTPRVRGRLLAARELLVVTVAETALAALVTALALEHPTLHEPPFRGAPPSLRHTRQVVHTARRLRAQLVRYRRAVELTLVAPPIDDLPF